MASGLPTTIRHAEPQDYEALYRLFLAPEITQRALGLPQSLANPSSQWVTRSAEEYYLLVACIEEDHIVGSLELKTTPSLYQHHSGSISSIAVFPALQRQGIGTKLMSAAIDLADHWLNLHRLELLVFTDNIPAIALFENFGFAVEAMLRHFASRADGYADVYLMTRFKDNSLISHRNTQSSDSSIQM